MSNNLPKISNSLFPNDDFFEDIFPDRFLSLLNGRREMLKYPKINVSERDNSIIVTANVPGIPSKDISIDVEGNMLRIAGHTKREEEEGNKDSDFYRFEREEGSFTRTITLPSKVNESKIEAKTKNGVLTIKLEKENKSKEHKISIKEE